MLKNFVSEGSVKVSRGGAAILDEKRFRKLIL